MTELVLVHGGVDMGADAAALAVLREAATAACTAPDPLEAVVAGIAVLEDHPLFNAGYGSVLNDDGDVEVDAAVVDGTSGRYGAVGAAPGVRHPAQLALGVLRAGRSSLVSGLGARRLAERAGHASEDLRTPEQQEVWRALRDGSVVSAFTGRPVAPSTETVGCLALRGGRLVAGSSTGGVCGKELGRIGDSAILGAGVWADERAAVVCSGDGESMIVLHLARRTAERVHRGEPVGEAVCWAVRTAAEERSAVCAVLALDVSGNYAGAHNGASFPVVVANGGGGSVVPVEQLAVVTR